MRVLFIASDNTTRSGAFLSMTKLATLLRDRYGVEPIVILSRQGEGQELLQENGIPFLYVRSYNWIMGVRHSMKALLSIPLKAALNLLAIHKLKKTIRQYAIDIVHINTSWTYVGAMAAHSTRTPVVWHLREYLEEDQSNQIWIPRLGYRLIGKSDAVVAISKDLYAKYEKLIDPRNLQTIYNGIDADRFYDPEKEIFTRPRPYFVCIGGLYPGKGQMLLINACAKVRSCGYDFELHIVGKGNQEEALKKRVSELGLEDCVVFEGFNPNPEVFYKHADVVFMVSKCEAFGRVTVEAMLGGALVIGSRSGATTELLDNGYGYLYDAGSEDRLAEAVEYVLSHRDEARQVMRRGRARAVELFPAEKNAENVYEVYQRVLEKAR